MKDQIKLNILNGNFHFVIQPIFELSNGAKKCTFGGELLIRMSNNGKPIPPDMVISVANEYRLNHSIFASALLVAIEIIQRTGKKISINLESKSAANHEASLFILQMISKLPKSISNKLIIEFTERSRQKHKELNSVSLAIQKTGVKVWLDDIGSTKDCFVAWASVSANGIKLDKSIVENKSKNYSDFIDLLSSACSRKKIDLIIEGIENRDEIPNVKAPILAQGYLFEKPMPVSDFINLVTQEPPTENIDWASFSNKINATNNQTSKEKSNE